MTQTVVCKTISNFKDECYNPGDKFRYAVIVPSEVLAALETTREYEYVRLTPHGQDGVGTLAQIISFSDDHRAETYSTDQIHWACIRTSLQRQIGVTPTIEAETKVDIHECELTTLDSLAVHRHSAWEIQTRNITTDGAACYIHSKDMAELDELRAGDICELINTETSSRIRLPVEVYQHKNYQPGTIRLNGTTRKLLAVDSNDEGDNNTVQLRILNEEHQNGRSTREKVSNWIGRRFVDYSYMHLRVLPGYDRDEGRNIVRMNRDVIERLGIEENDRAYINWKDNRRNVRCQSGWNGDSSLEADPSSESSYGEEESLSVRMPSTERDNLNISVGDSIRIRRDMGYQAGKQVSLSLFGILGVLIGTSQLLNMIFADFDLRYVLATVASATVLSIPIIWFILKPVRQKCRSPE
ncbi:hypothetical protein ACLI4Z_12830 [Natrialbaceae archaeon A-arb3/5]